MTEEAATAKAAVKQKNRTLALPAGRAGGVPRDHATARAACDAVGVEASEMPGYQRALATLAASTVITERTDA
jgi:hypothetical protein